MMLENFKNTYLKSVIFIKKLLFLPPKKGVILHIDITKNISLIQKLLGNKPFSLCIFIISCSFYLSLKCP